MLEESLEVKKLTFAKNLCPHFTLKISASQRFGTYPLQLLMKMDLRPHTKFHENFNQNIMRANYLKLGLDNKCGCIHGF